jgi:hypothetical protein
MTVWMDFSERKATPLGILTHLRMLCDRIAIYSERKIVRIDTIAYQHAFSSTIRKPHVTNSSRIVHGWHCTRRIRF